MFFWGGQLISLLARDPGMKKDLVQPVECHHDRIEEVNLICPDRDIAEQGHILVNDQLLCYRELFNNHPAGYDLLGDGIVRGMEVRGL